MASDGGRDMEQVPRYQETLRRLSIFDERVAAAGCGLGGFGLDAGGTPSLDLKTAALLQVAASTAMGSSAVCLEWSTARALAAGATKDEIVDVLLAIGVVAGVDRIVSAAPLLALALDYDVEAALADPDDR